ncbi:MAG: hypothetical protein AAGM67_01735, partial [Bacteroidota bacterium]
MADAQQNPEEKPENSQKEELAEKGNQLLERLKSWISILLNQLKPFFVKLSERIRALDLESAKQAVMGFVKRSWQNIRAFRWNKENLQAQAKKLKAKSDEFVQSESFQKQKAKLSSKAKELGQKAQDLGAASTPILQKAKAQIEQTADSIKRSPKEPIQTDPDDPKTQARPLWDNPSGLPSQIEILLLKLARIPWMRRFMDWWSS